ncbi:MAG: hypothetical protein IT427_20765 [Pirellulales bacterium]|nr:hypothetical protein [Pirellulales bacterium]
MNYLAHGRRFLAEPLFLAGTALPDWLGVVDRRARVRARRAREFIADPNEHMAAFARGIVQHHDDDHWFHTTTAFTDLSWQLTAMCRDALPGDAGFRPSFLGHILVELLLDSALAAADPVSLDKYYAAIESLDPSLLEAIVNRIAPHPVEHLGWFVQRFCRERFLFDYAEDGKLLFRLNQVLRRARLPALPDSFTAVLETARIEVTARHNELLAEPSVACAITA